MTIWIIVIVIRGLIEEPEIFLSKDLAYKKFKTLSKSVNPDYDEVEIFEKNFRF